MTLSAPAEASGAARRLPGWLRGPVLAAVALALVLHVLWWVFLSQPGGDLAAQVAWSDFATSHPNSAYDLAWYGGMHPVSYSILSPYLMSWLGVRTLMVISGTVSAGLVALLVQQSSVVARPWWPAMYAAVALTGNAVSGRVTFAAGTVFALAALVVVFGWADRWQTGRGRRVRLAVAAALAALATASSPVAGLFLGVCAAALWLTRRRSDSLALGLPPVMVVVTTMLLFPFSGIQPLAGRSIIFPVLLALGVILLVPRHWRTVRIGAALYLVAVALSWALPSPVGSNVTRLALLFGGVLLVAAAAHPGLRESVLARRIGPSASVSLLAVSIVGATCWQVAIAHDDATRVEQASLLDPAMAPLVAELRSYGAGLGRVEVVATRSHLEAAALAPYVNLARGWNRQADVARNPLFYAATPPTAVQYRRWLHRWAVRFVVLPRATPDYGAGGERRLVMSGLPYLDRVWSDAHWVLYRVQDPRPVVSPPASVVVFGAGGITITTPVAGPVLVRVVSSPWLSLVDAQGKRLSAQEAGGSCLTYDVPSGGNQDQPGWIRLEAAAPGTYRIAAPYAVPRGTPCPE